MILPWLERLSTRRGLGRYRAIVPRVLRQQTTLSALDNTELRRASLALRYRVQCGELLSKVQVEAFALAREAARRRLGMEHFDVQLVAGAALFDGAVVEMQTGEGKTLAASAPLYLTALAGRGVHLATANDYLAKRDAELLRPLYEALGMTVGAITADAARDARRLAYAADITYGTAKEFGFDFLRDRLWKGSEVEASQILRLFGDVAAPDSTADASVRREAFAILVDEADSIMIDEARTPLVVSATPGAEEDAAAIVRWGASIARQFREGEHYEYAAATHTVTLTALGRRLVRTLAGGLEAEPIDAPLTDLYEQAALAVRAERDFVRDRQYIVRDDEVVIVDEFTGRLAEGRRWRDGLHQAIEAREGLAISRTTKDAARITVQDFLLRYERLGGMTGTAANSARELREIYRTKVLVVPTHRSARREQWPEQVFATAEEKWQGIVAEVQAMHATGRPVLVGTRSIDKSQRLSQLLTEAGMEHRVLSARHLAAEADIVAEAGERGRVTVATNMAGRGTDIRLGGGVAELGGLHVIVSELHESSRIDRQLIGRCSRQGDAGSYRVFLSLEDEILTAGWGPKRAAALRRKGERSRGEPLKNRASWFYAAQRRVEREHFANRRRLMEVERERRRRQEQLGQDPYLDAA